MRIVLIIPFLLFVAVSARAQTGWETVPNGDTGGEVAAACGTSETGRNLCFMIGCNGAGDIFYSVVGAPLPATQTLYFDIWIDGRRVAKFTGGRLESGRGFVGADTLADAQDILSRLKRGRRLALVMDQSMGSEPLSLSLSGSSRAIAAAVASCPEPRPETVETTDPGAHALQGIRAACAQSGGTVTELRDDFMTEIDFDTDGVPDRVVNAGGAVCSAASSLFCGSAGCHTSLWRGLGDGRFRLVYGAFLYEARPAGPGRVDLAVHGSLCGGIGADACTISMVVGPHSLTRID